VTCFKEILQAFKWGLDKTRHLISWTRRAGSILYRESQQLMWCVDFSGVTGGLVTSRSCRCTLVSARRFSLFALVGEWGDWRRHPNVNECFRVSPHPFFVQHDDSGFSRVFLKEIAWIISRVVIFAKSLNVSKCILPANNQISRTVETKTLCSLWFENKYGWTTYSNVINSFNMNCFTRQKLLILSWFKLNR